MGKHISRMNKHIPPFLQRHREEFIKTIKEKILQETCVSNEEQLLSEVIPDSLRTKTPKLGFLPKNEHETAKEIEAMVEKNHIATSLIGQGYYGTILPHPIQRYILENPSWYTAYTPYQSEISQGRMEALLNYQTLITDLTGFQVSNASLLDEGTAAAESMIMFYALRKRNEEEKKTFFVSETCFLQTIDVVKTRARYLGINIEIGDPNTVILGEDVFGALLQYPDAKGEIHTYSQFIRSCKEKGIKVSLAADIMALLLLKSPAELGADCAVGSTQRFGIPMGYGGPHAAYFATNEEHKRFIPGRIIGVSKDRLGGKVLRMALQTREQHIKRQKATSNICTSQVLLAVMSSFYAVYHGPKRLKEIASRIAHKTRILTGNLKRIGITPISQNYFDTITLALSQEQVQRISEKKHINFWYTSCKKYVSLSIDESTTTKVLESVFSVFSELMEKNVPFLEDIVVTGIEEAFLRKDTFLEHEIYNSYHTELEFLRYVKRLEKKDYTLTDGMIPLGSCTMKLNSATQLLALSNKKIGNIHPFVPKNQVSGYTEMIERLGDYLCKLTGFSAISFQPNSGAQGEYAGLLAIRRFHQSKNNLSRNIVFVPDTAHGTNPASAVMAGCQVIVIKSNEHGYISEEDLQEKIQKHGEQIAGIMITYPSTSGVFEENIQEITQSVHNSGGLVYMDGANLNAQIGLTTPKDIGADVCHINLHKTFAIPHGGGGPGMGPICCTETLQPFLPQHFISHTETDYDSVSAAEYGSASILSISYTYILMLGENGLRESSVRAILNANYMKNRLEPYFNIVFSNTNKRVGHEFILDCREFKKVS